MSGGGGSSSAPSNQTVTSTSIPEYARPYAESMLGQTSALTNINNNPYQPYQGQQIAGFSPMQVQGMTGIANQQVAPQITDASNFAFQSGAGGLGAYQNSAGLQNAALDYGAAGAQGAFANADLINAYGGEAFKSGQLGQQLGIAGGAKFGNMGAAAGQLGQDIGTAGGAYYGGQGMGYGAQGANLAGANLGVGMTGMQAGLGYGQGAQNPNAVQGYMNPYLQAALQPQLAEMQRQYGISGAQGQSNATKAGAFGGSREALIFAENQRNKNIAMNQAIGQGYNTAYDVANKNMQAAASLGMQGAGVGLAGLQGANQNYLTGLQGAQTGLQGVNTQLAGTAQGMQGAQVGLAGVDRQLAGTAQGMQGASLGMQGANQAGQLMLGGAGMGLQGVQGAIGAGQYGLAGLGLAGSAGSTLGALGQTQFGQQQAINQAQLQAGAQQQALQQQGLNVAYQQYQDQMNYPYKQLAFQSDMMRGLPLSQSSQTMYQNTGAMAPQILGAGLAAYGATNKSAKEGGLMSYARGGAVQGYAMGGQPVVDPRAVAATSPAALSSKLAQLSDGQLQAYARTVKDAVALAEVKAEMARRAGVRQPQGEEPTQTVAQEVAGQGGIAEQPIMAAAGGGIVALNKGGDGKDKPGEIHDESSDAPTQTPNWTRFFPEGSLIRNLRLPVGSDVRNALNSQRQSADSAVQPNAISPEALAAANQAQQQQEMDSQVQTGMVPRAQLVGMNQAQQQQEMDSQVQPSEFSSSDLNRMTEAQQMQDADSQVQPRGGIVAIPAAGAVPTVPPVSSAIAGATPRTPVATGAPTGGGITSVAPNVGGAPRTGAIGNAPVDAIGKGAVPVGSPNDMSWGAFAANVKAASQLEPEDKALLADMQKRADRRLARAEGQEKNVLNEALISGGLAMMGGLNLSDGVKRMAEAGGKQYFASKAEASKAINAAEDAQDAFNQYQMSYKQGNKKMIGEMYGKWQSSMLDFQGKIQAAGITAGASLENARATREATAEYRVAEQRRHDLDRDQRMQIHQQNMQIHKDDFVAKMAQTQNIQAQTLMAGYESKLSAIQEGARKTAADLNRTFAKQREELQFAADKPEVKAAKVKALELKQAAELKTALDPYVERQAGILAMQDNLMSRVLGFGTSGASENGSTGRVVGVRPNP